MIEMSGGSFSTLIPSCNSLLFVPTEKQIAFITSFTFTANTQQAFSAGQ